MPAFLLKTSGVKEDNESGVCLLKNSIGGLLYSTKFPFLYIVLVIPIVCVVK